MWNNLREKFKHILIFTREFSNKSISLQAGNRDRLQLNCLKNFVEILSVTFIENKNKLYKLYQPEKFKLSEQFKKKLSVPDIQIWIRFFRI